MTFPNSQSDSAGAIPVWQRVETTTLPETYGATITLGGTAQDAGISFLGNLLYVVVQNPPDAASQGIVTAENLFLAINGDAVVNGAENYLVLAPGGTCTIGFPSVRFDGATALSVVAATTGHKFLATAFYTPA